MPYPEQKNPTNSTDGVSKTVYIVYDSDEDEPKQGFDEEKSEYESDEEDSLNDSDFDTRIDSDDEGEDHAVGFEKDTETNFECFGLEHDPFQEFDNPDVETVYNKLLKLCEQFNEFNSELDQTERAVLLQVKEDRNIPTIEVSILRGKSYYEGIAESARLQRKMLYTAGDLNVTVQLCFSGQQIVALFAKKPGNPRVCCYGYDHIFEDYYLDLYLEIFNKGQPECDADEMPYAPNVQLPIFPDECPDAFAPGQLNIKYLVYTERPLGKPGVRTDGCFPSSEILAEQLRKYEGAFTFRVRCTEHRGNFELKWEFSINHNEKGYWLEFYGFDLKYRQLSNNRILVSMLKAVELLNDY